MQQARQQVSQPQIQEAQQQLKSAGLYRGAVDGVMGPETQTALSQFQREQGLPQTAQLDQQTLSRLIGAARTPAARQGDDVQPGDEPGRPGEPGLARQNAPTLRPAAKSRGDGTPASAGVPAAAAKSGEIWSSENARA